MSMKYRIYTTDVGQTHTNTDRHTRTERGRKEYFGINDYDNIAVVPAATTTCFMAHSLLKDHNNSSYDLLLSYRLLYTAKPALEGHTY